MSTKDTGALVVAGVSLLQMLLNAWMGFRPPVRPPGQLQLPCTWRELSAVMIRLALVVAAIWMAYVFTGFHWQSAIIALAGLLTMYLASIGWKLPMILLWCVILYCVLQNPSVFSAQILWLAPQLTIIVLLWRFRLAARPNGEPHKFFYVPFWLGILGLGALADRELQLDAFAILGVGRGLGMMQPPVQPAPSTIMLDGWVALFCAEHRFSIGAITLYTSFMLVGVLAVWARWLDEPILVALPIFSWIVAMAVVLAAGWPTAAITVAIFMVSATLVAARAANVQTKIFHLPS